MSFQDTLAFGKLGEAQIASWLKRYRGYQILPIYEKQIDEGKGPVIFLKDNTTLVAPDLLVFRSRGDVRWIEAKTKTVFAWYRKTQKWTTGIDYHHYTHYLKVAEISPWEVWLLFLHISNAGGSPIGLFGGTLDYLSKNEDHRSDRWGKGGMVYWDHSKLQKIATIEEVNNAQGLDHITGQPLLGEGE